MWEFVAGRKRSRAEKALLLFVESGCVYCVLQYYRKILNVVFVNLLVNYGTAIDYMSLVIREIYTQVTAMYPMAVLVLVNQIASSSDIRSIPTFDESTGMQSEETSPSLA
ncbi:hypothetical protein DXG01_013822 [Tephrocybe rancida]|nr:hypothetical protein DXG01_013822 [Tephrocybe rancida]